MRHKSYPSYKDSGVEWVGDIPTDWEIHRLKFLLSTLESGNREKGGGNTLDEGVFSLGGEHIEWNGTLKLLNARYVSEEYYNSMQSGKIRINDVLLVKDGATIGKTAIVKEMEYEKMAVNEHVFIIRPNSNLIPELLYYLISGDSGFVQIKLTETGSAQGGINLEFPGKVIVTISPKIEDQELITFYLDKKVSEIDKTIQKDTQLIELLKEKRIALINHVVTKGLDADAKMKDSGVEWISEIPKDWKIQKLKIFSNVVLGKMLTPSDKGNYELKPYLRAQNILWENVDTNDIKEMWFSKNEMKTYKLQKGDLLVSEGGEVGRTAIWKNELNECYIQNSVHKITLNKDFTPRYFLYTFEACGKSGFFESIVNRVSIAHLTREKVKEIYFPVPSDKEQKEIAEYLDAQTSKIDEIIQKIEHKIKLMEEYKKSLIHNVVTGKIDVRGEDSLNQIHQKKDSKQTSLTI